MEMLLLKQVRICRRGRRIRGKDGERKRKRFVWIGVCGRKEKGEARRVVVSRT